MPTISPVNVYETLYLLDTSKVAGDVNAAAATLHAILEKHHGEILASRVWTEQKLAYPIGHQKKGLYYLIYFQTKAENLHAMDEDFAICEILLRKLTLKIDPKWVETMLSVARDERALCYQAAVDEPLDPTSPMGGNDGGRRSFGGRDRDRGGDFEGDGGDEAVGAGGPPRRGRRSDD